MIDLLNVYRKGLQVERLHTIPHLTSYNNGFHSCNAALIAHELCKLQNIDSASVMRYMLLHDVAEGYIGDTPANVKRDNPEMKSIMDKIEGRWEETNIPDMPDLCRQELNIAKASDCIECGMYCIDELSLGNTNVKKVLVNIISYLGEFKEVPGIEDIIGHFVSRGLFYDRC